jgi:hypothetical protein
MTTLVTNIKDKTARKASAKKGGGKKSEARKKAELEANGQKRMPSMERPKSTPVEKAAEKLYHKQLDRISLQTDEKLLRDELAKLIEVEKVELPYVFKGLIVELEPAKEAKIKVHLAPDTESDGVE